MRKSLFLALGRIVSRAPRIRGKTRLLLLVYRMLGLEKQHIQVRANLRDPVPFVAELDLHAWLQRVAFLTGGYEGDTVRFLLRLHEWSGSRGYLLDVGANIGLLTIPFARSVTQRPLAAVAVEAVPDNLAVLRRNIDLNELQDAIRIVPFALGEVSGTAEIQVEGDLHAGEGTGTANIMPVDSTYECVRQTIVVKTLDELTATGVPSGCSVMKIDTDGYDLKVLQGGVAFLAQERPLIFGEFSRHCLAWHGQTLADIITFADGNGYEVLQRVPGTWKFTSCTPASMAGFNEDLLLIPNEHAARVRALVGA